MQNFANDVLFGPLVSDGADHTFRSKGIPAELIRRSAFNKFVVNFHGTHGVHEIECDETHVQPNMWDKIDNADYFSFQEGFSPTVLVGVGEFDFDEGKFTHCVLRCPMSFVSTEGATSPRKLPLKKTQFRRVWGH